MQQEESTTSGNHDPIHERPTWETPPQPPEHEDYPVSPPCSEEPPNRDTGIIISPDGWDLPWKTPGGGTDSGTGG